MTIKASSYPTSRPTLDLNFAQTKRLDPRVTFSRSSSGTYFDANGVLQSAATNTARFDHNPATGESLGLLVEEARTNSATYSSDLINGGWGFSALSYFPNAALAPDNTQTALFIAASTSGTYHYTGRNITVSSGATVTISAYLKQGGYQYAYVYSDAAGKGTIFDLSVGTAVGTILSAPTSNSIKACGNGWYLCSITVTVPSTSTTIWIGPTNASNTGSFAGNGTSGTYVWGIQVEAGSFPTSYIPTPATFTSRASSATYYDASGVIQTAATNVARSAAFFPDSNGVMRSAGLLLEAAGTNQTLNSGTMVRGAEAVNDGLTITASATTAPDGAAASASLVVPTTSSNAHQIYLNPASYAGTFGTLSMFVKANGYTKININAGTSTNGFTVFDISGNGNLLYKGSDVIGYSIQRLADGWFRISTTNAAHTNTYRYQIAIVSPDYTTGVPNVWTGNGTSGMYIWGLQFENSYYPTSYIPTTTATVTRSADVSSSATVTRSADVASITGTNFSSWYNQSEGTMFVDASAKGSTAGGLTSSFLMTLNVTGSHIFADVLDQGTSVRLSTYNGSSSPYSVSPSTSGAGYGSRRKAVLALKSGNYGAALNGAIQANGTNASALNAYDRLGIGYYPHFDYGRINSTISRLTYWPTRLSDATLQAITL